MDNLGMWCGDFFVIHPMKYHNKLSDDKVREAANSGKWIAQVKYDGAFFQLVKNSAGDVGLFSRTVSKKNGEYVNRIDNVPHVREWADKFLPNDSILLGEIYVPGGKSNDATKIMGCLPDKAIQRQKEQGNISYYIFDCLKWNGEDLIDKGFKERYSHVAFNKDCLSYPIYFGHNFNIDSEETLQTKLSEILEQGGEGLVLKDADGTYKPDKRPMTSFKLKQHVDSLDFVIMDILDPEVEYNGKEINTWKYWAEWVDGKLVPVPAKTESSIAVTKPYYYGWKNAFKIGAYDDEQNLVEVGRVASGFTDELRADVAANPSNYIGYVAEVACMLTTEDQTLRHPYLIRVRDDKDAKDCKLSEIFS
jgi:ATP-dependent DNA ligase